MVLESGYELVSPLPRAEAAPDVSFSSTTTGPAGIDWTTASVVHADAPGPDGTNDFVFALFPDHAALRITGAADFHLWPERIVCHLLDEAHGYLVEIALLGMVLALWLELRGVPTLHGSAAVIDGRSVGFLGAKGGGKTSTVAACVASGHALLSEDLLAVDERDGAYFGRPGYPMLRLWPDQAERFAGPGWQELPTVHPDFTKRRVPLASFPVGAFHDRPSPLHRLYVLDRLPDGDAPVTVVPVSPRDAVMTLLRHSFLPREVQRYGLQPARMALFTRLCARVPVARLRYPPGFDRLPEVVTAVAGDVVGR